jgi:hypothetical protein
MAYCRDWFGGGAASALGSPVGLAGEGALRRASSGLASPVAIFERRARLATM